MLSTYAAAGRGRNNKDWRAPNLSADLAIVPDAETLNSRARQIGARDSWIAESAVAAFARNVVGCGIIPIPQARDETGELLVELNRQLMGLFWEWAGEAKNCDVEEDQTYWQMQTLVETERATVGQAFIVWSYEPNLDASGRLDLSRPVGLKLQMFETEQLNNRIISWSDPLSGESREVRGGMELDARGRVVAYHVFSRNPNDYMWRQPLESLRIDASRVLRY